MEVLVGLVADHLGGVVAKDPPNSENMGGREGEGGREEGRGEGVGE